MSLKKDKSKATISRNISAHLPTTVEEALEWVQERQLWAKEARERDQHGSAREFELTALLLEAYWREYL